MGKIPFYVIINFLKKKNLFFMEIKLTKKSAEARKSLDYIE